MSGRSITVRTNGGDETVEIRASVPQGSVLGPALWNVVYDEVLRLKFLAGVEVVGYADDLAIIVTALTTNALETATSSAVDQIREWMAPNGICLAPQKTEATMLCVRRYYDTPEIYVEDHRVQIRRSVKYLGVIIDKRMSFREHLAETSGRAVKAATAVGRLMPNMGVHQRPSGQHSFRWL